MFTQRFLHTALVFLFLLGMVFCYADEPVQLQKVSEPIKLQQVEKTPQKLGKEEKLVAEEKLETEVKLEVVNELTPANDLDKGKGWKTMENGLEINVLKDGNGDPVEAGDTVSVHYTGTFLDGRKFDSSLDRDEPFQFTVGAGRVIQGWDLGVVGMQVGERRSLRIPSNLAYGSRGAGGAIPPNTDLLFEIELLEIRK